MAPMLKLSPVRRLAAESMLMMRRCEEVCSNEYISADSRVILTERMSK
jgi:hypothetical protein